MNAQESVAANVAARGYRDGWTTEQFVARQLAKLTEELAEATDQVMSSGDGDEEDDAPWLLGVWETGRAAGQAFDDKDAWSTAWINNQDALRSELADMQVVLFAAAAALDFDVVQAAIDKSGADVARGVR